MKYKCQICGKKQAIVIWKILNVCEDCYSRLKEKYSKKLRGEPK